MSELKACPFCKKPMDTDYSLKPDDESIVMCWQCGAECELSEWDKRPLEDELQKRIEKLEGKIKVLYEMSDEAKIDLRQALKEAVADLREWSNDAPYLLDILKNHGLLEE